MYWTILKAKLPNLVRNKFNHLDNTHVHNLIVAMANFNDQI